MSSKSETNVYLEHRVCGESDARGPWSGPWRKGEPSRGDQWDIKQLAKRNERVWIERRRISITDLGREDAKT